MCDKKAAADTKYVKTATAKVRWHNAKHREGMCACSQERYYKVCIARAAINENLRTPHNC